MYYPFENKNQENNNWDESDEFKVYNKQSSFKDYKNISKATPQNIKLKGIMREATITQKIQKKMVIFDQTDDEIESIRNKYNKKQSSKSYKVLPFVDEISTCKMKNPKTTMPDEKDSKHVKYCTATDTGTPTDRSSTNSRNESLHSYKESYSSDINEATRIPNIVKNSNKLKNYQAKKEQNFDENLIQKSNHNEKENKPAKEPKIAENINELNFLAHQKFKILKESLSAYENIMKKYNAITAICIIISN